MISCSPPTLLSAGASLTQFAEWLGDAVAHDHIRMMRALLLLAVRPRLARHRASHLVDGSSRLAPATPFWLRKLLLVPFPARLAAPGSFQVVGLAHCRPRSDSMALLRSRRR